MSHTGDSVVSFLKKAATKLEELQLQTALGKAELSDRLEEIKKKAQREVSSLKAKVNATIDSKNESYQHLKAKIEHLELQLALGKAETKDEFEKQKKKLKTAIHELKVLMDKD